MTNNIIHIKSTQKSNMLVVRWDLNNVCNFKCRYCFPGSNEGTFRSPKDLSLIIKNFNSLLDQYKTALGKDTFHLQILGGEPTVWKNLAEFIRAVKQQNNLYLSVTSNGSRTLRWWEENGHLIDNLILSFHQEFADLDHTIKVADTMYKHGKNVTVHVLMDDKCWNTCVNSINYMKKNSKYPWIIQAKEIVSTINNLVVYTLSQRKFLLGFKRRPSLVWIIKNINLLRKGYIKLYESIAEFSNRKKVRAQPGYYLATQQNQFKGWECNLGLESIYIGHTGDISGSCGQRIFDGALYNIFDTNFEKNFKVTNTPVVCQVSRCVCQPETHITKKKF